jgi:hypothetical protein
MPLATGYQSNRALRSRSGYRINPSAIVHDSFVNPAAAVTNGISVSHVGQVVVGTVNMTLGGSLTSGGVAKLDFARNVVITVTHGSAVIALSGVITGTDIAGDPLTEAWSVTAGTTSKTFTGLKAFKSVTSITEVNAADASGDTIIAGTGTKLGLSAQNSVISAVKEYADGAIVTTGTLVAGSTATTTTDPRGTYAPATAPDGVHDYDVWYISDNPEAA